MWGLQRVVRLFALAGILHGCVGPSLVSDACLGSQGLLIDDNGREVVRRLLNDGRGLGAGPMGARADWRASLGQSQVSASTKREGDVARRTGGGRQGRTVL